MTQHCELYRLQASGIKGMANVISVIPGVPDLIKVKSIPPDDGYDIDSSGLSPTVVLNLTARVLAHTVDEEYRIVNLRILQLLTCTRVVHIVASPNNAILTFLFNGVYYAMTIAPLAMALPTMRHGVNNAISQTVEDRRSMGNRMDG